MNCQPAASTARWAGPLSEENDTSNPDPAALVQLPQKGDSRRAERRNPVHVDDRMAQAVEAFQFRHLGHRPVQLVDHLVVDVTGEEHHDLPGPAVHDAHLAHRPHLRATTVAPWQEFGNAGLGQPPTLVGHE